MATRFYNHYGENTLIEPTPKVVREVWRQIGDCLIKSANPGTYQDKESISSILNVAYHFVETRLARLTRRLASREFMEVVLYQYDLATNLWRSVPEGGNWDELHEESHYSSRRRALKHLAEETALRTPPEYAQVNRRNLIADAEEAILCADILVALSMMSDRTHYLFPSHSRLTLFGNYDLVPIRFDSIHPFESSDLDFNRRLIKFRNHRPKCLPTPTADMDSTFQAANLDECFSKEFSFQYREFLNVLARIPELPTDETRAALNDLLVRVRLKGVLPAL